MLGVLSKVSTLFNDYIMPTLIRENAYNIRANNEHYMRVKYDYLIINTLTANNP